VVLPPQTENLNRATWKLLAELANNGGQILQCGATFPQRQDGSLADTNDAQAMAANCQKVGVDELPDLLSTLASNHHTLIKRRAGDTGILFHHRRHIDDGELLLLVNTSITSPSAGVIDSAMKGIEQWNLYSGKTESYPFEVTDDGIKARFDLPPSGSLMLFLSRAPITPPRKTVDIVMKIPAQGDPAIRRLEPNVLTLDYVDVSAGGETKNDTYFYAANAFVWQKNGMDRNPWDSAVQFKDELISQTFPPASGFEARYKFTIEGSVPTSLAIVIERPDLYAITCNDTSVNATRGDWWLDKAFGRIPLNGLAHIGQNVVTLKAQPFTMFHELEPAYVLGEFTLKPSFSGFVIAPDEPLRLKPEPDESVPRHGINPDGTMWLSGGMGSGDGAEDRQPFVIFDLGQNRNINRIHIWNYNENHVRDLTSRGADKIRLSAATADQPDAFKADLGTFRLSRAPGNASSPDELNVSARGVRYVRMDFLSNQYGVEYPAAGNPVDNGFVGLAEVQFFAGSAQPLTRVTIHRCSSELASHQRQAIHLVDGSGFGAMSSPGWNQQGHPFYANGVAYTQQFSVSSPQGQFTVRLGDWYGSVARVNVNGRLAGYISAPPWECDVTPHIKRGDNAIEVVAIGTLKNTLGPHHNGSALGSAWPGMFQRGPNPGPPPGNSYHTVGYGLFEPFELEQMVRQ